MNREWNTKETKIRLSPRLEAVAAFVPQGSRIADIGTDHGYLPISLLQTGRIFRALAMDLREGPLRGAREHMEILAPELRERMELRLSDGLSALRPGEADTVVIAGMGGELMAGILERGNGLWNQISHYVLSPQSELAKFRRFLEKNGFCVCREAMVRDEGKFYTIMDVSRGFMKLEREIQAMYGPCLLKDQNPVLKEYLACEQRRVAGILNVLRREQAKGALAIQKAERVNKITGHSEAVWGREGASRAIARERLLREMEKIREAQYEMQ